MMQETEIPGLDPQRDLGFVLDTGEAVAVRIQRAPNQLPGGDVSIHLTPRLVDKATGATIKIGEHDAEAPTHTATIQLASFSVEGFQLLPYLAGAAAEQAPKARAFAASLRALGKLAAFNEAPPAPPALQLTTGATP